MIHFHLFKASRKTRYFIERDMSKNLPNSGVRTSQLVLTHRVSKDSLAISGLERYRIQQELLGRWHERQVRRIALGPVDNTSTFRQSSLIVRPSFLLRPCSCRVRKCEGSHQTLG